ncbi:uncharacterized protein LOC142491111 [Ascaphus truei]|uniref:uncharacterized protein LOC142491111 n=1 Tax=Ascaphus truei TaxID=8439 RepID=UPI003F5A0DC3
MEEAFLLLYQEFQRLQAICIKQAELLQKLLSKKGIAKDMPVSMPIQCTDAGDPTSSESPFIRLQEKKEPFTESSKTTANELLCSVPVKTKEKSDVLLDIDFMFPPSTENDSFLASEAEKVDFALDLSHLNFSLGKRGSNADLDMFIKNYMPQFPNVNVNWDTKKQPVGSDQILSLSNLYEDPCYLQSKDISLGVCLAPENKHALGIRGPAQSSWSPGCLSEDCPLGCHVDMNSDVSLSSQICDFCQAVFPAGAATKGEYLRHITGHVE